MMGAKYSHTSYSHKPCKTKTTHRTTTQTRHLEEEHRYHHQPDKCAEEESSVKVTAKVNEAGLYSVTENVFYKFVILHAETDIEEALRIKNMLEEEFHLKPGIIFAEMPAGAHIMNTLDTAINGSAWTIILLTQNFLNETWCEFQSHATLINSINMRHKYNTVIPVRPKNNFLPRDKTPFLLRLINALEENRPAFTQQVAKAFQEHQYLKQHAIWKAERTRRQ
ncbi:TIR domain-containing adapter molecule 2 [Pelobates fuscus]|uniref:TIR domain-containing adapter molecule 2 n=1 Tax=Pelobates fuscus TaxID=191477 RepID=UPI002FE49041